MAMGCICLSCHFCYLLTGTDAEQKFSKQLVMKKEEELGKKLPRCLFCHWVLFKPPWYEDQELKNMHYKYCWEVQFIGWGSVLLIVLFGFIVVTFMDVS